MQLSAKLLKQNLFPCKLCPILGTKRGQLTAEMNMVFSVTCYLELHVPISSYY